MEAPDPDPDPDSNPGFRPADLEGAGSRPGHRTTPPESEEEGSALDPAEARMARLMEEFRRRQRKRPDVAVRPWWSPAEGDRDGGTIGFVLEYCPRGRESSELVVRLGRVTAEGPAGVAEATIDLHRGWWFEGRDVKCPETLANYLLRMASETLGEAA